MIAGDSVLRLGGGHLVVPVSNRADSHGRSVEEPAWWTAFRTPAEVLDRVADHGSDDGTGCAADSTSNERPLGSASEGAAGSSNTGRDKRSAYSARHGAACSTDDSARDATNGATDRCARSGSALPLTH
jgi:hypothetical protein